MRLSDDVRQVVVFLGPFDPNADDASLQPKGTGFLINGDTAFPGQVFLATAKHVAERLKPPFAIRLNKRAGGFGLVQCPSGLAWCFHDDDTVDLAVAPIRLPSWAKVRGVNAPGLLRDQNELMQVGVGDSVCVIGLFHLLYGRRENLPITHVGHLAMLPGDERIPCSDGVHREGFLVQANAISGCSGSPVFAGRTISLRAGKHSVVGHHPMSILLGVWSSSWKIKGSEIVTVGSLDGLDSSGGLAPLGMGMVTPLSKLVQLLWSEKVREASRRMDGFAVRQLPEAPLKESPPSTTDKMSSD